MPKTIFTMEDGFIKSGSSIDQDLNKNKESDADAKKQKLEDDGDD